MVTEIIRARDLTDNDVIVERSASRRKPKMTKIRNDGVGRGIGCHGIHVVTMDGAMWCYTPESPIEVKA
jgi:hypothetical protein